MVFCKNCGYEGAYLGVKCPVCKKNLIFTSEDLNALKKDIAEAKKRKEFETVAEGYHVLADFGDTDGEREYARMLEMGDGVMRNLDSATEYYRRAAEKFDAKAAYRYSELVSRMNGAASKFWLVFSAFLGCSAAYLDAAKYYQSLGEDEFSNHYLYLAAMSDDIDAIVKLSEKYYTGSGVEQNGEYAKWYIERLTFPPLYAIRLALKLRSAKGKEPPNISVKDNRRLILTLIGSARRLELSAPIFYLTSLLFEKGDNDAGAELGEMYINGIGTAQNTEEGIRTLSRAAASGSSRAYVSLGKLYFEGELTERNVKFSLSCFENAARLGDASAYELLGDIYHSKDFPERDVAKAARLYKAAAEKGSAIAKEKAEKIYEARDGFYKKAMYSEKSAPEEAFKNYYIATAMGHPTAKLHLALAYLEGKGVKRDSSLAFSYYESALNDGCEEAHFPLGLCYAHGIGTAFDFKKAIKHLAAADRLGDSRARPEIISLYENKKKRLARKLYSTAMRLIYLGKFSEAHRYLNAAQRLGHSKAVYTLGCLYEFGKGRGTDRDKAYLLYKEADEGGFSDNRSAYKLTVLKMIKKS